MRPEILNNLSLPFKFNRAVVLRYSVGLFLGYFFLSVLLIARPFYSYKDFEFNGPLSPLFELVRGPWGFSIFVSALVVGLLASILFTLNVYPRLSAAVMFVLYVLTYNFHLCINQPHISYINYVLLAFLFLPRDHEKAVWPIRIAFFLFLIQMSISGWSKFLMPEWRQGEIVRILTEVRDPAPGIYFAHMLPSWAQKVGTWLVMTVECLSAIGIILKKVRNYIWWTHFVLFSSIVVFVPYATHVAAAMVIFLLFVYHDDSPPAKDPYRVSNVDETFVSPVN